MLDGKKEDKFIENDNIYKNDVSFEGDDFDVDAETIVINEEDTHSEPAKKEQVSEDKPKPKAAVVTPARKKKPIKPVRPKKTVKKVVKKASKRKSRPVKKKSGSTWPWIVLLLAIAVVAAILLWRVSVQQPADGNKGTNSASDDAVVATVNGQTITLGEIQQRYDSLNPLYKQFFTLPLMLNQTIDEMLLLQTADELGFSVDESEIDNLIETLRIESGLTAEDLDARLAEQGISIEYLRGIYGNKLLIDKLINETILSTLEVSEEEAMAYYEENKATFATEDQVKVRHVLVAVDDDTSLEDAQTLVEDIATEFESGADFCDLVKTYSDDPGSIDTCGEYTFGLGQMVPEFETLAFELGEGDTGTVQTSFGFHFMEKLEDIEGGVAKFDELEPQITETVLYQKQQEAYTAYITDIRENADITANFELLEEDVELPTQDDNVVVVPEEPEEEPTEEPTEDIIEEEQPVETEEDMIEEPEVEVVPEEPEEEPTEEPVMGDEELLVCLNDESLTLYGAYWKKDVKDQRSALEGVDYTYVECDANLGNPDDCEGIGTYPTWEVNGIQSEGVKTLSELGNLAGC